MRENSTADFKLKMLAAIRELASRKGISPGEAGPGRAVFFQETGFVPYDITRCGWVTWSEALTEAGYASNTLQGAIPLESLLVHLAELTREIGRFPTQNHVRVATNTREGFPAPTTFARLGPQREKLRQLREWCAGRDAYADVVRILDNTPPLAEEETEDLAEMPLATSAANDLLSDSVLPPVVASLPMLAARHPSAVDVFNTNQRSINSEFERRVGVAFAMLGFVVEDLGQGKGAVADGIAKIPERNWAVIYDAKVRGSGYRLLTDDRRKFRDYIDTHRQQLASEGIRRIYFAVVSSGFTSRDLERANEVKSGSDARACVLLEAAAIAGLIERKIRRPRDFSVDLLERVFEDTRIVTRSDV